ncbi:scarecrow-like protein 21 [Glycine soja]|uniref:Chitin-inducible gibberellin-responsive protein 1 isoform A n=1 Tax=Glycine soja TaxID=3848 RepID=A0A445HTJ2_GLYSO|nr:scarecrow-like protein 21 [Glycine soja]RZB76999.1 Chitin-inducible gibberellin-responsive protein 1 isoform A [Glycine soja]RZB77000.1 Chitin-inducible gibberellin-responsive protein 1 isoform B [Glycine soja]
MDSQQLFSFGGVTSAGLPYMSSFPTVPSLPNRLLRSLKYDTGNSPNSPFSTYFDSDTLSALSDGQEQYSPGEILSGVSSSLETNHYMYNRSISTLDSFPLYSYRNSLLQNASSNQKIQHALLELETALMAPDDDQVTTPNTLAERHRSWNNENHVSQHNTQAQPSYATGNRQSSEVVHVEKRQKLMEEEATLEAFPPNNLKQLLIACAKALSENNMNDFDQLVGRAKDAVSINGEPIQRLGAYMVEGLVARTQASGNSIYHALRCKEPEGDELLTYMQLLFEICPYLKFGYMAANGAIAEACRNEDRIHIIDFQIAQGTQWMTLLQALAARPGGAPHVRITGIDDPVSKYARGDGPEVVGKRLALMSEKFGIPVEFHGVPVFAPDVTREMLDIRPGEALAVNFPLQLHHTADESVHVSNPRDGLLRLVRSLSPKVTTLVEQESNTNTTPFFNRFIETLDYYLAIFESIDVTLPRDSKERINVEQHCLARDIVNIIACEGKERVERHELFGKWKSRLKMAGFQQCPLSSYVNSVIRSLLRCYSEHYTLVEKDGAMLLGWKDRNLISASAWHC